MNIYRCNSDIFSMTQQEVTNQKTHKTNNDTINHNVKI